MCVRLCGGALVVVVTSGGERVEAGKAGSCNFDQTRVSERCRQGRHNWRAEKEGMAMVFVALREVKSVGAG